MEVVWDLRTRLSLEQYLQDLICGVENLEQVGVLVEALLALQYANKLARERARAKSAGV
jgi:hypothetical protein